MPTNRASPTSRRRCLSSRTPASRAPLSVSEETRPSVSTPAAARDEAYMGRPMEVSQSETLLMLPEGWGLLHISVKPPDGIWATDKHDLKRANGRIFLKSRFTREGKCWGFPSLLSTEAWTESSYSHSVLFAELSDSELVHAGGHVLHRLLQVLGVTLHQRLRDPTAAVLQRAERTL